MPMCFYFLASMMWQTSMLTCNDKCLYFRFIFGVVVKDIVIGAVGPGLDFRADEIGRSVGNGSDISSELLPRR